MTAFILLLGAVLCIFLEKRSEYERSTLRVDRYAFSSPKLRRHHRFVFLSDMHECAFGPGNARLLALVRREEPDFILIGGDMILCRGWEEGGRRDFRSANRVERTAQLLSALKQDYPVYLALGNHEQRLQRVARQEEISGEAAKALEEVQGMLRRAAEGCTVLDGASVCPEGTLSDLMISGVSLPERYYEPMFLRRKPPLRKADYRRYAGIGRQECSQGRGRYRISLLHSPQYHREAIRGGADLVLSGHVHGGTIRLPVLGALMTPQYRFFVKECAGVFSWKGGHMLVNRGLGTHSINIRINDFPEISVVDLLPGAESREGISGWNRP